MTWLCIYLTASAFYQTHRRFDDRAIRLVFKYLIIIYLDLNILYPGPIISSFVRKMR